MYAVLVSFSYHIALHCIAIETSRATTTTTTTTKQNMDSDDEATTTMQQNNDDVAEQSNNNDDDDDDASVNQTIGSYIMYRFNDLKVSAWPPESDSVRVTVSDSE